VIGARAIRSPQPVLRQLAPGVRAGRRKVGYLGSEAALTVINVGDPLPGGWSASWSSGTLVVNGDNVTIDHYQINASVVFQGLNPTMTNCRIHCNAGDIFGVTLSNGGVGVLNVSDTTVVGNAGSGTPQVNGISTDGGLVAVRCDVSGTGDGIHIVARPDQSEAIISQCYIHDQAFIDELQHCDGIQVFNNTTDPGFFTVEHCYVELTLSTIGTPINAAMTCGTSPSTDTSPLATPIINNNYFASGVYHLRLNYRLHNCTVTNNDFGALDTTSGEFALVSIVPPVVTWSGNKNSAGGTIANPNPLTAPTIKEVLQTADGQTSAQTLSTTAGTTLAGDTLLVVYATDNNTASAPTSTAGTLAQIGTDAVDGDGNGLLRVYSVTVGADGSKDITMPAAGGFDIMGAVLVVSGLLEVEGFVKTSFASSVTSFSTPAATLGGSADLLISLLFNKQGKTFDLTGSGLTQKANPSCLPFSALAVGTAVLTASGTSPTYTVGLSGGAKPAAVTIGAQRLT
jgi:hypothetical protein